mmetsp:Transcript_9182/g.19597  ORF Transcript_9182/g.19597 Transcript_9182/m.19597 type:complete len:565 (-) Transcript_9182:40-1734(-)
MQYSGQSTRPSKFRTTFFGRGNPILRGGDRTAGGTARHTLNSMPMLPSSTPLEERLIQIVVFELREDGTSSYNTMTLRGLYNCVVATITENCKKAQSERQLKSHMNTLPASRNLFSAIEGPPRNPNAQFERETITEGAGDDSEGQDEVSGKIERKVKSANPSSKHRERLGGYLHPRDMRRLVTPFSASNEPSLMIRRHVMLLNFDPLRAVVLKDRLLVLVPDGADSLVRDLEKRVKGGIIEMENQVFGIDSKPGQSEKETSGAGSVFENFVNNTKKVLAKSVNTGVVGINLEDNNYDTEGSTADPQDDEWEDLQEMNWSHMAFELQSVDAVLQTVTSMLMDDAGKVHWRALQSMRELRGDSKQRHDSWSNSGLNENAQERLRIHKDEINEMESRVQGFVRAVNCVLDSDEDLSLMNLSRLLTHPDRFMQPVSRDILHEESDEPELILEAYMQQSLTIVNELDLLKGQITTTEEQISMMLDTIRNRLLYINTLLSVASLCVAVGSFVGSVFGMNLTNHFEDEETIFVHVAVGTVVGMFVLWFVLSWVFYRAANTSRIIKQIEYSL